MTCSELGRSYRSLEGTSVLLTGAMGMLAWEAVSALQQADASLYCVDIRDDEKVSGQVVHLLDITNREAVLRLINDVHPHWIINCAAYTAVDKAEEEPDLAMKINADGAGYLAEAAAMCGAKLVHISSDYVFGAYSAEERSGRAFDEDEELKPCGVYGRSKAEGDLRVLEHLPDASVIARTSWLHGVHGPNFIDTMLRVGPERGALKVVDDQIGSPTWAGWLAQVLVDFVRLDARGVFNTCSRGGISWFDFACEIFSQAGLEVEVSPQTTEELNRPAPRPPFSTLSVEKLEALRGEPCLSWTDCVREHLLARELLKGK